MTYLLGKNLGYRKGMQRRLLAGSMVFLALFTTKDPTLAQGQEGGVARRYSGRASISER
jgi:hypothetical protein